MWLSTRVSVFHLRLWSDRALRRAVKDTGFRLISYRAELELSWPIEKYISIYVQRKFRAPAAIIPFAQRVGELLVRFKLMRNKAIVIAIRED